jgi:Holliday junction DNA helicase RuvB
MESVTGADAEAVYSETLKLLSQEDSEGVLERLFEAIVQWQREHPRQTEFDGFEWFQVQGDARTLNKFVTRRILKIAFKSNKSTLFWAPCSAAIEKAVDDYRGMCAAPVEEEPQIPPDLFNVVIGHQEKKEIIWRAIQSPDPVDLLLWGSIASAKTLFLEELRRLPKSYFVLGSSLSKAGLYEVMFDQGPKYLIIDEIDKISDEDNLSALLSLTERGFLSETKYHRHRKRFFRTWVFASANYRDRIPKELLSRFGKLHFIDYTDNEFLDVTAHVLTEREKLPLPLSAYVAEQTMKILESKDVRDAVRITRLLKTKDKNDIDRVVELLRKQR